jgi:hypothetical protein
MIMSAVLEKFIRQSPVTVMMRAAMEYALDPAAVDTMFERTAERQYVRDLLFSSVVDLMSLVVAKIQPSVHAAYELVKDTLPVTLTSIYNKLDATEPRVAAGLVSHTAERLGKVIDAMGGCVPALLPGYRVRILDGNHLASTERRLEPLRQSKAGPRPGFALVVLDPQYMLATDMIPCEDAHTQERSLTPAILELSRAKDVWIADRNFCTTALLTGWSDRDSFFAIRHHANMTLASAGTRRSRGCIETGQVYEQPVTIADSHGKAMRLRLITLCLDKPTRDGDMVLGILTNLPTNIASAKTVARLYRNRWTLEAMFLTLTQILRGEVETLGYPKAALLCFALALATFNIYSTVQAALRAEFGVEKVEDELSDYAVANEVQVTMRGMEIAVDVQKLEVYQTMSPEVLGAELRRYAKGVRLSRFKKHPRGPKKPPAARTKYTDKPHISTARILAGATGMGS